jgi:hypothetical protein
MLQRMVIFYNPSLAPICNRRFFYLSILPRRLQIGASGIQHLTHYWVARRKKAFFY